MLLGTERRRWHCCRAFPKGVLGSVSHSSANALEWAGISSYTHVVLTALICQLQGAQPGIAAPPGKPSLKDWNGHLSSGG